VQRPCRKGEECAPLAPRPPQAKAESWLPLVSGLRPGCSPPPTGKPADSERVSAFHEKVVLASLPRCLDSAEPFVADVRHEAHYDGWRNRGFRHRHDCLARGCCCAHSFRNAVARPVPLAARLHYEADRSRFSELWRHHNLRFALLPSSGPPALGAGGRSGAAWPASLCNASPPRSPRHQPPSPSRSTKSGFAPMSEHRIAFHLPQPVQHPAPTAVVAEAKMLAVAGSHSLALAQALGWEAGAPSPGQALMPRPSSSAL